MFLRRREGDEGGREGGGGAGISSPWPFVMGLGSQRDGLGRATEGAQSGDAGAGALPPAEMCAPIHTHSNQ